MEDDEFTAVADELYGVLPAEFTEARNGYAKELRAAGDRALSDRVKALRKPSAAAWVVNLLVRHHGDEMTQLLDLGASLRGAQADLDGEALRELTRQRRKLVSAVAGKGRLLARELGQKVSESVVRQVEDTLHAAMVDTDAEAAVRTGMLVDPLSPAGAGSLKVASAVADHTALGRAPAGVRPLSEVTSSARDGRRGLSVVPEPDPAEREREQRREARTAAKQALRAAQADLTVAAKELKQRGRRVADLQAATLQVNGEIDELRRSIDALESRLERLDEQAAAAVEERDESAEAVALAESAVTDAQSEIDRLSD